MIVLHASGGSEIGIGHLSRSRSLAVELLRQGTREVVLLYEASPALGERFAVPGARLVLASDRESALELRGQLARESGGKSAVLVTDLLKLGGADADLARKQGFGLLAHLNDSGWREYRADLLIDGSAFKGPEDYPGKGNTTVLCGARYHIVEPSVAAHRPSAPWREAAVRKVLLCFGGADPGRQTELFVRETGKGSAPVKFTVVAGPAFSEGRRRELEGLLGGCHRLADAPSEMAKLILEHDVVVTLGGLTSYEAMCLGRAVFSAAWAHMKPYVEKLAAVGLLKNLGEGPGAVAELYRGVADVAHVSQLAQAGWKAIDGKGAERAAKEILQMADCRCL